MAIIGEFSLKYYNKNLYKNETLDTLPTLIEQLKTDVTKTKKIFHNGAPFPSYDHYADAKAFYYQALERLSIARGEYKSQIIRTIQNMEDIAEKQPELSNCLTQPLTQFRDLLQRCSA